MTSEEFRLACLKLVVEYTGGAQIPEEIIRAADQFYKFVLSQEVPKRPSAS